MKIEIDIIRKFKAALVLIPIFLLSSCGGDLGGGGACGGAEDSGICLSVMSIDPTSVDGTSTSDVDAIQNICPSGDPEIFGSHPADIVMTATTIDPTFVVADFVLITDYTIEYTLQAGVGPNLNPGGLPQSYSRSTRIDIDKGVGGLAGLVDESFAFMPLLVTNDLWITWPGGYPRYTATYTFNGRDSFDNPVSFRAFRDFTLGDFDRC